MDNNKELYYRLEYIKPQEDGEGHIKIKVDFNKHYMEYTEIDVNEGIVIKSIYIRGYDYWLALDALLEADEYRSTWLSISFLV